jgi:hypothetical protein
VNRLITRAGWGELANPGVLLVEVCDPGELEGQVIYLPL